MGCRSHGVEHRANQVFKLKQVNIPNPKPQAKGCVKPTLPWYSWIANQRHAHEKSIFRRTRRVTTLSRPPLESSRRGESDSVRSIFV